MAQYTKVTRTVRGNDNSRDVSTNVVSKATTSETLESLVYFLFGILEVLLVFRLIFKLTGASFSSAFADLIYGMSGIFILPFEGIFHKAFAQGVETTSVLKPSTLVAIVVYAILAFGIVKLMRVISGEGEDA